MKQSAEIDPETICDIEDSMRLIRATDKQIGEIVISVRGNNKPHVDIKLPTGSLLALFRRLMSLVR